MPTGNAGSNDQMPEDPPYEQEETDLAAQEAASIGGRAGDEDLPAAERAVREGGGGEAEGFEESEAALIEHASHGDMQSAHAILHDQGKPEENDRLQRAEYGEADSERSSQLDGDADDAES
ncbi:MAG TPA: hypothetical protein VHU13_00700 [Solirubrobacteraceae bacterium]|nr:hypothetical protein [Solirubrobacteraceae bacterium]